MCADTSPPDFRNAQTGTSLLELTVALAAGFVILASAIQALSSLQRQFTNQQVSLAQQQDVRLSLELLGQELHLAGPESLFVMKQDEVEFGANVNGVLTTVNAPVPLRQTAIPVEDGRDWPERKTILVYWDDHCELMTLARNGQRSLLTVTEPIPTAIPAGALVSIRNRVRYYSRRDENGNLRLLRQVDGGASVLVGDIQEMRLSYWNEQGRREAQASLVRRIVVELVLSGRSTRAVREISLRT